MERVTGPVPNLTHGQHNFELQRNIAALTNRLRRCVRFDPALESNPRPTLPIQ